jgi:formate/nitrite transporter FocA (FNT family)
MAILSGIMIGIGGSASLLAGATLGSSGKLIGAFLFTLGIFAIVTFEMRLFTGMVADIPEMKLKNIWKLPICFLANIVGFAVGECRRDLNSHPLQDEDSFLHI